MTSVGVRELRQSASELLRRVAQGETIEITDRGRPVALLTPLPDSGQLMRLRAGVQIDVATGDLADLPDTLVMPAGSASTSATLARLREFER